MNGRKAKQFRKEHRGMRRRAVIAAEHRADPYFRATEESPVMRPLKQARVSHNGYRRLVLASKRKKRNRKARRVSLLSKILNRKK